MKKEEAEKFLTNNDFWKALEKATSRTALKHAIRKRMEYLGDKPLVKCSGGELHGREQDIEAEVYDLILEIDTDLMREREKT